MSAPTWKCILHDPELQRSSHVLSVLDNKAYVFGGELIPRQPRDNKTIVVALDADSSEYSVGDVASADDAPAARVGTASATLASRLYLFSGRGGPSMSAIEESGGLWCFDPNQSAWTLIKPSDPSAPFPAARSYHCMNSDGGDKIFVHAGCPAFGRLTDLWQFSVSERVWTQLADAPAPQRGGTSIAFSNGRLYRMNGFDGKHEQGGVIDAFDLSKQEWTSKTFSADGIEGPEARSVSVLLSVNIHGKPSLVTLFGERDPSNLGHAGAGKMLGDFWIYDLADETWRKGEAASDGLPPARGWFDADVVGNSKIVVVGGLDETNERLDDVWVLSF